MSVYHGDTKLSYVHFIEPRFDRIADKGDIFHNSWNSPDVSNAAFRDIVQAAGVPCLSCGGWDAENAGDAVETKKWDMAAFAKWFVSNPDLPERLRLGVQLQPYDRSRFYGSWDGVRENGYVDYPTWEAEATRKQEANTDKGVAETSVKEVSAPV